MLFFVWCVNKIGARAPFRSGGSCRVCACGGQCLPPQKHVNLILATQSLFGGCLSLHLPILSLSFGSKATGPDHIHTIKICTSVTSVCLEVIKNLKLPSSSQSCHSILASDRLVIDTWGTSTRGGNRKKRALQKLPVTLSCTHVHVHCPTPASSAAVIVAAKLLCTQLLSLPLSLSPSLPSSLFLAPITTTPPNPTVALIMSLPSSSSFHSNFFQSTCTMHKQIKHVRPSPHPPFFCGCAPPNFPSFPSSLPPSSSSLRARGQTHMRGRLPSINLQGREGGRERKGGSIVSPSFLRLL